MTGSFDLLKAAEPQRNTEPDRKLILRAFGVVALVSLVKNLGFGFL